jgi:aspartate-semialdehyde dehydrogenase
MPSGRHSQRIVIAGASSLLGNEVKSLLEESLFATWDLRLVDEEDVAGTLTEASGEPAFIQRVEEDTFHGAKYAFLTGSTAFAKQCLVPAREAGATIIDFSRATLSDPEAAPWFPKLAAMTGRGVAKNATAFAVFSVGGIAVASLALTLQPLGLRRLTAVMNRPVSESGREGIEELETQTSQLLSFQSVGQRVFGAQAAFNLLPCFGAESRQDLWANLLGVRAEVSAALGDAAEDAKVAVKLVHAPVFYGTTFSVCADLQPGATNEAIVSACRTAGFTIVPSSEPAPSNVTVAGETSIFLQGPQSDPVVPGCWWFWGAGDNLRVPASNGCKLAEWLEA